MDERRGREAMKRFKPYPAKLMKSNFPATTKPKGLTCSRVFFLKKISPHHTV